MFKLGVGAIPGSAGRWRGQALLFLRAGSIIHAMGGEQDNITKKWAAWGGKCVLLILLFYRLSPFAGVPPFAGFNEINLAAAFANNPLLYILLMDNQCCLQHLYVPAPGAYICR